MAQNRVTIGTKINEDDYAKVELMAKVDGMSITALVKLLVIGYKDGDIVIKGGEIKQPEEEDTFSSKVDQLCDRLRDRSYPESYISKWKGAILEGMRDHVEMMPKKYDARRMRADDWGC